MAQPPSSHPKDIAYALQQRWAIAFSQQDWNQLASLYTQEAQLFGGKPELFTSRQGVLRYFEAIPPGVAIVAEFGAQNVIQIAPDVIVSAGDVIFRSAGPASEPKSHRITLVLIERARQWRIASHHASPKRP